MRLTVLGAGPAYTDRDGATGACYLVTQGDTHLLLDLGQGSFTRIFRHLAPENLTAIVVSHLHPDHMVDLVPMRHYLRYEFEPPRRMRVLGPGALADRLDALHAEPGFTAEALDVERLGEGASSIGALSLETRLVAHTDESYGIRVAGDEGPGLVYSGDCGRAEDLAPLVRPGDTLLAEVSFGAGPVPPGVLHLDGPAVGQLAASTGAGRVLLTHLLIGRDPSATVASVRASFDGPVEMVWPGSRIEL
ncbi:MAG: MBL fold metallo-hydrolase [Chloroflexi bacterium]|nr:MBL fold metallo-hydrolase [Chloroflexota bacterium]